MRKLPLILLATILVFGFSAQAGAAVSFFEDYNQVGFSGAESIIDFTGIARGVVSSQQDQDQGFVVTFSAGLYGENFISVFYLSGSEGASNMNLDDFTQSPQPVITAYFPELFTRVGFDALNYGGDNMTVTVYRDGKQIGTQDFNRSSESLISFIGVEDPEGIDEIAMSGNGSFNNLSGVIVFDNLRFEDVVEAEPEIIPAKVDIKPGNCMNPLNIRSRGVLPVAIHTDENLDATQVDPTTVLLMGVAPLDHDLEFVPDCSSDNSDADDLDLTLKFDTAEIVKAIGEVNDGDVLTLQLTGKLYDGTEIAGEDAVAILAKTKQKKRWKKRWKKHSKKHSKKHWKEHSKEHPKKHWKEKLKEKWKAFKTKWKTKRQK